MTYQPFPQFADWDVSFDEGVFNGYAARLQQVKAHATGEDARRAVEVATRYAAVDTGAIEGLYSTDRGFTRTIALQSEFWQRALDEKGEQVKRHIEDALAGYEYVLDAATGQIPITAKWIRELHAVLMRHQDTYAVYVQVGDAIHEEQRPLAHGEYKSLPNNPTNASTGKLHDYAPPEDTDAEMTRLTDELASPEFVAAHPVVQAAYAHYAYVCVHPFADGNGRVARALASVYLYRNPGIPLVVFADQRDVYLDALEAADEGKPDGFVKFMNQRAIDAVQLVQLSFGQAARPSTTAISDKLEREAALREVKSGVPRLAQLAMAALSGAVDGYDLPVPHSVGYPGFMSSSSIRDSGTASRIRSDGFSLGVGPNVAVLSASNIVRYYYFVARVTDGEKPELAIRAESIEEDLDVWFSEVVPTEQTSLNMKLKAWADVVAAHFVDVVNQAADGGRPKL